uniref:Uncharacterized protein n=1 Tax=Propithecus coquereli TaxID=379532 RepID=A0A2K6FDH1_PROCO
MGLSRGLGTDRRRVLLGRVHYDQLESRLHTGLGRPVFLRYACRNQHDASKSPALLLVAWILFLVWTLKGQSLGTRGGVGLPASQFGKVEEFVASSL